MRLKPVSLGLILLFVSPYLILAFQVEQLALPQWSEFSQALTVTVVQASLSALVALMLGLLGALGLLSIRERPIRLAFEIAALLPGVLPPLMAILAALNFFQPFPFGVAGVVIVHTLLNVGLVAVAAAQLIETKVGRMAELAWLEGAGVVQFGRAIVGFLGRDLLYLFLFVWAICFTSFSVPLLAGGHFGRTLEVLIYEKIRIAGLFHEALVLALLQTGFVFISMWLFVGRAANRANRTMARALLVSWRPGLIILIVTTGVFLWGLCIGLRMGVIQLMSRPVIWQQAIQSLTGTWLVSVSVGTGIVILLGLIASQFPNRALERFLFGWIAPSSVLTGFALLLLAPSEPTFFDVYARIAIGLILLLTPVLYRWGWHSAMAGLRGQVDVARVLSASRWQIFSQILWPQLRTTAFFLAALGALWAAGDFALSGIIAGQDLTLAMTIAKLTQTYRFEMATALVWMLMGCGLIVFLLFWSLGYVGYSQSDS